MSDPILKLDRLATAARGEVAPTTNVAASVMAEIASGPRDDNSLAWFAAVSAAGAALALIALAPVYQAVTDPVVAMLADLSWGLL